jgi:hypothetical protein
MPVRPNKEMGSFGHGQAEPAQEIVVADPEYVLLRVSAQPSGGNCS